MLLICFIWFKAYLGMLFLEKTNTPERGTIHFHIALGAKSKYVAVIDLERTGDNTESTEIGFQQ